MRIKIAKFRLYAKSYNAKRKETFLSALRRRYLNVSSVEKLPDICDENEVICVVKQDSRKFSSVATDRKRVTGVRLRKSTCCRFQKQKRHVQWKSSGLTIEVPHTLIKPPSNWGFDLE
jgi:hypothetical protein